uniref:Nerve growth factor-related domain-containing protein n=1 Tax=Eptatretus burgeri TaxID=7764 RepID=A0A8C4QU83_EPTBU
MKETFGYLSLKTIRWMEERTTESELSSGRVVFSDRRPGIPPGSLLVEADAANVVGKGNSSASAARPRRYSQRRVHRGEYSVCDSESHWVTDKKSAYDIHGQKVNVLEEFRAGGRPLRQYFYETRCKEVGNASCRGIDERYWASRCKTTQSYARALTLDERGHSVWTWIRLDTACVCTLTRKFGRYY